MSNRALVLVANAGESTISTFTLDNNELNRIAVSSLAGSSSTFAVDAERQWVFASEKGDPASIATLKLDAETGELTEISRRAVDGSLSYVTITADGRWLLGASYGGHFGFVAPILEDGSLGDDTARIEYKNLHAVIVTKDGRNAYFVSLGDDVIAQYVLDEGTLTPITVEQPAAPKCSGPRHIVLDADEANAYVVTEFSGEALQYVRDAETGALTLAGGSAIFAPDQGLGHSVFGADPLKEHYIWGADIHLSPNGRYLWASERTISTIATVPVSEDGRLGLATGFAETELQPRGFTVTPDGGALIVAGERSKDLRVMPVIEDGQVGEGVKVETGAGANWVRVVELGR